MPDPPWTKVDNYFDEQLSLTDSVLEQTLTDSHAAGLPPIQVSPAMGKLLNLIARIQRSRRILEIGTLGGYSTIWLARALPADGRLVSLELEDHHARVARANLERAGLLDLVTIQTGPAVKSLQRLTEQQSAPFDLIFIDADKVNCPAYFEWALRLSCPGTVIITDNVVRNGAVADEDSDDESVVGIRQMFDDISNELRVSATAVQTVGCKGYDGFCLAVVEESPPGNSGQAE